MSKLIVIVGGTGCGKTTLSKSMLNKVSKHLVNDINNEYKDYICFNPKKTIDEFLNYVDTISNTLVIIDESTVYFSSRSSNQLLNKLLTLKRHSKNNYVLIFHSLLEVPKVIFNRIDYLILFKTNDNYINVVNKFGRHSKLLTYFAEVKRNSFKHFYKEIDFKQI